MSDEQMEMGERREGEEEQGQEEQAALSQAAPPSQPHPQQQQQQNKKGTKRQPDNPCIACGKNVTTNSVQCTLWCHKACTNLSAEAFNGLEVQAREVGVAYWACRACLSFANKVNRQLQATSKHQDELENKVDSNIKATDNNTQEIEKLRAELNRMQAALEKEREERCDMLSEELRDREVRRNNLMISAAMQIQPPCDKIYKN
jgi:hypothetical protein